MIRTLTKTLFAVVALSLHFPRAAGSQDRGRSEPPSAANPVILGNVIKTMTDLNGGSLLRGDTVVIDVSVTNSGTTNALLVALRDTVPTGLTYVPGSLAITSGPNSGPKTDAPADDEARFIVASRIARFFLGTGATPTLGGTLAPGQSTSIQLRAVVSPGTTSGQVISNRSPVTYTDPISGNDVRINSRPPGGPVGGAPTTITVQLPDVTVAKSHVGSFVRGQQGTYTIQINNIGLGATAGTVTVTDVVPAGLTPVTAAGAGWSCAIASQTVTCTTTVPIVAGGSAPAIVLTVDVLAGAPSSVTNTATVTAFSESNMGNNSGSDPTAIVDPLGDLAIVKSHAGNFAANRNHAFTIAVSNTSSQSVAGPVTVTDTLPAGLTFLSGVGAGWSCSASGQIVTCTTPGPIAGSATTSFTLNVAVGPAAYPGVTNRAHVAVPGGDANAGNDSSADVVTVESIPDLAIVKTATSPFVVGSNATYLLAVTNVSTGPTGGPTVVTDTLPAGLTFVSAPGFCSASGQVVTCTAAGLLGAGVTANITITVAVGPAALPSVTNRAHVATLNDVNIPNNSSTVTTPVTAPAAVDLAIVKTSSAVFTVGSAGTYTLLVTNVGAAATTGAITVTDTLPNGITFSAASGLGWTCLASGQVVTCTHNGPVAPSASLPSLDLTVAVASPALPSVVNRAHVATSGDSNQTNDQSSVTTPVNPAPVIDLTIAKSHTGTFVVGQNGTYDLVVSNLGNTATMGPITVTDTLAAGLTFSSFSGAGWSCSASGQEVTCTHPGPLPASAATNVTLTVAVGAAAVPQVVNRAHVSTPGDANTSNDHATVTTPVGVPPVVDLSIAKSHSGNFVALQPGTYTVVVSNVGSAATTGTITVTDTLPNGLGYSSFSGSGWACAAAGQVVTCTNSGPLAPAASSTVTILVSVGASAFPSVINRAHVATPGDGNSANNSAADPTTVIAIPDLAIAKSATSAFTVGANATYSLVVSNIAPGPTTGLITVTDNLPAGLTYVAASGVAWTCGASGPLVTCTNPGPLAGSASSVITLTVAVGAAAAPNVTNSATVTTPGDVNAGNNTSTVTTPVGTPSVDLSIAKTSSALVVGTNGTFTLTVSNLSMVTTTGPITVTDNLPAGLTFVNGSGPGFVCVAAGQVVTCTRTAPLAGNQSAAITLTVSVGAAALPSVVNSATVSTPGDTNLPNNSVTTGPIPVAPAAPDLAITKTLTSAAVAGQNATFAIGVTNVGAGPTTGPITVTDVLMSGLTFVSGSGAGWSCAALGQAVTCTHPGPLAPNASTTITLTVAIASGVSTLSNTASVATPGDGNAGNNSATIPPVSTTQLPDLALTKVANGTFRIGQPATYTLTVTNVGAGPTTGPITVIDQLPAGLTFVSATGPGWTCSANGGTVRCTHPGPLAPNATTSITLTVLPGIAAAPSVINSASVSTPGDPNPGNDGAGTTTPVEGTVDLGLTKQGPDTLTAGGSATYTLTVRNVGTLPTSGTVTIADSLPAGLTFQSGAGSGFSCAATGQVVTCTRTLPPLGPGATASIDITVSIASTAAATIRNAACVATPQDTNATNNCGEKSSATTGVVDLVASKDLVSGLEVGQPATFALTVRNVGLTAARPPLTFVDTLQTGLTFVSASGSGWSCSAAGNVVTCTRTTALGPNETSTVNLVVNVGQAAQPLVTNCATVRGTNETGTRANNQACISAPVTGLGRLELLKRVSKQTVQIGDLIEYAIVVRNTGTGALPGVVITDVLPPGFLLEPNSARVGGTPIVVAGAPGPRLTLPVGTLAAASEATVTYRVRVGPGSRPGASTNLAVAESPAKGVTSPTGRATVRLTGSVFEERGAIVGKVYTQCDCDRGAMQDDGEVGIPGVRVFLEDGTSAVTDVEGKYNFYNVTSRLHVVKVDRTTLPPGAVLVPLVNRNAGDGYSRFVDLKAGELHRADFADGSRSNEVLQRVLERRRSGEVNNAGDPPIAVAGYDSASRARLPNAQRVGDSLVVVGGAVRQLAARPQPSSEGYTPLAGAQLDERNSQLPITPLRARALQEGRDPSSGPRLAVTLGDGHAIPADGVTMTPITVRLTNATGQPVPGSTTLTLEASLGRWLGRDLGSTEQGIQVMLENGEGQFTLVAATQPGRGDLRVTAFDATTTIPLLFVPVARELLVTGLVNARVDFQRLVRGGLSASAGGDAFEESIRDWSFERDSGKTAGGARAAVLVKGAVLDNRLFTMSFDTERDRGRTMFRDIRPDEFFPVYGDASMREFDAQTNRRFYARLDKGTNYSLYGDFETARADGRRLLSGYDRSLTGAVQHVEGGRGSATVYASRGRVSQVIDELLGRSISGPYALSRTDGLVNSERVEIVVRDRNQPSVILARTPMTRFADYTVEAGTGRLLFRAPIANADANLNPVFIRVTYEVEDANLGSFWLYGGDGSLRLSSRFEVGATYARDDGPSSESLLGFNSTLSLGGGTTLLAEFARTDRASARAGDAHRVELRHQSARVEGRAFAVTSDGRFRNTSSTFSGGRTELGGRFSAQIAEGLRLIGEALRTEDNLGDGRRDGALLALEKQLSPTLRGEVGYRYAKETGATAPNGGLFQYSDRDVSALRGRLQWTLPQETRTSLFAEYEQDLRDTESYRGAVGGEYLIANRARLFGRHEWLTSFEGPYTVNQGRHQQNTVFGVDADYLKNTQMFSEYRARDAFGGRDAEASIGLRNRWAIAPGLVLNTSFRRVSPLMVSTREVGPAAAGDALAATAAVEWTRPALWKSTARVEVRDADVGDNFLASFGYARKLSRDWTLLGRTLWDEDDAVQNRTRGFSQLGFAWRQTDRNHWNALARYEHRFDRRGPLGSALGTRDEAHIVATLVNYQPAQRLTLSGRYAAKTSTNAIGGISSGNTAQLLMGRGVLDLTSRLDAGVIASSLFSDGFSDRRYGLGAELGLIVMKNLRVAGGYNVFGFTDKDLNSFGTTRKGPYLELGFKFDESLFGIGSNAQAPTRPDGGKQ